MKAFVRSTMVVAAVLLAVTPTQTNAQIWTDWTAAGGGVFSGFLGGTGVTYTGTFQPVTASNSCNVFGQGSQLSTGLSCNYWDVTAAYTQGGLTTPTNNGMILFFPAGGGVINFVTAVVNPYIAFISVGAAGRPANPVTYTFDAPFSVLSNNNCPTLAHWGCGSYSASSTSLTGTEFSGTIQFLGTFNSINLSFGPDEYWHAITVGADRVTDVVPEPATMGLLATGLVGLMGARRRRTSKA